MMMGLTSQQTPKFDMFETKNREMQNSVMVALDTINNRWGKAASCLWVILWSECSSVAINH
jgi:hypothetical protein